MGFKLTWMPDVLLGAGLKVAECEGWRERGRADMGTVQGVMVHHTGTAKDGNMPTLEMLKRGRTDLVGPLANLGLGRDGTFYVVAAGRANHAGIGRFRDITTGNSSFIGIEAEHIGDPAVPWPDAQMEAYQRGVAALLRKIGAPVDLCVAHKEWALPVGRKVDPCFDMSTFRSAVAGFMARPTIQPPIPSIDGLDHPTIRRGDEGVNVERLQDILGIGSDGNFGPKTEAALREWQRGHGLNADGICGPKTWAKLLAPPDPAVIMVPQPVSAPGALALSPVGIELIHSFEGCARKLSDGRFKAYPDPGSTTGRPWTIGWGSTGKALDGSAIDKDTVWDRQQCDDHFNVRIQRYVGEVARAINGAPTTQAQFDAMVSFHYNTGAIAKATLTKRHIAGDFAGAEREFGRWVRNDGKIMAGLVRRRQAEADLYAGNN